MSRIPMREAIVASSAVSVVVSLCLVGAFAAGAAGSPASGAAGNATDTSNSPVLTSSGNGTGNRASMSGSHQGVWFGLADGLIQPNILAGSGLDGLGSASGSASGPAGASAGTATNKSASAPPSAAPKQSPVHEQSRSSALAAVSGKPRDIAQALAATRGWTGSQWVCLDKLWQHESMYQTTVRNASSGAYGIPQALPASKMASAGADWRTNPVTQIVWGLGYISDRYGSPCGAWSYWVRHYSY